jgi:hypothetical protein
MSNLWEVVTRGRKRGLRYSFHSGQQAAWDSRRRFIAMLAGTQSGKTSFAPLWLHREIQEQGPGDYLAITATFPLLKLKMLPEFQNLFCHTLGLGEWRAVDHVIQFRNSPTRIIFGSATNPESLESATAKAAVCDEAGQDQFRLESWEAILRRLSLNQGRALIGTTLYNLGWLKQQVYERWRAGDPDYHVIQFESIVNPAFPQAEFERAKATLPGWKFSMQYGGRYDRPAGLIYSDFRDAYREEGGHKVRPFAIPSEWPRHVGVDFGAVNTATIWLAEDPATHVYYLYRESLEGGKTSGEHAAALIGRAQGTNVQGLFGGSKSEVQQRLDWAVAGVPLQEPPVSDVESGIDRVIGLLKARRLYVFDDCKGVLDELGTYSRVVDEAGQTTEAIKDKQSFHFLDAGRYVVLGVTTEPEPAEQEQVIVWDERVHIGW